MQIGLRHLGGDPRAFYRLSPDSQIDVLAVLTIENTPEAPETFRKVTPDVAGPKQAKAFWSFALGGDRE